MDKERRKDHKRQNKIALWLPIITTILANIITVVYLMAVFKTTVTLHMADESAHFIKGEKTQWSVEQSKVNGRIDALEKK